MQFARTLTLQDVQFWIGLVGGAIALITVLHSFYHFLRRRPRLTLERYYVRRYEARCNEHEVKAAEQTQHYPYPSVPPGMVGKLKRVFTIIEFVIRNNYREPVALGPIMVSTDYADKDRRGKGPYRSEWIYADCYSVPMYGPDQDYRVYDLLDRAPASLADTVLVEASGLLGRRIEIIERSTAPLKVSLRQRDYVPDVDSFGLEVQATKRSKPWLTSTAARALCSALAKITGKTMDSDHSDYGWSWHLSGIRREDASAFYAGIHWWSGDDLLPEPQFTTEGAPRP